MSDKSIVTMAVLNEAYQDLYKRLISIDSPWNVLGNKTWKDFWALTSANVGDTWNISDIAGMPSEIKDVKVGSNLTCTKKYEGQLELTTWRQYWMVTSGVNDIAQDDKAGLIKTRPITADTPSSTTDTSVTRGLHLDASTNQAYVDIPMATTTSYGLVDTNAQSFKGTKTFTDDIVVNGKITGEVEGVASKVKVVTLPDSSTTSTTVKTSEIKIIGGLAAGTAAEAHDLYDNGMKMQAQVEGFKISGGITTKSLNLSADVDISSNTKISSNTEISAQATIVGPLNVKGTVTLGTSGKSTTITSSSAEGSLNIEGINSIKGGVGLSLANDSSTDSSLNISDANSLSNSNITNTTISGGQGLIINGSSTRAGTVNIKGTTVNIGTDNKTTNITSSQANGSLDIAGNTTLTGETGLTIRNTNSSREAILKIEDDVYLFGGEGLFIKNTNPNKASNITVDGNNISVAGEVIINKAFTVNSTAAIGSSDSGPVTIKSAGSASTAIVGPNNGTINLPANSSTANMALVQASAGTSSWLSYTDSNTASTLVKRDADGNFSAGTITANLSGTATKVSNGLTVTNGTTKAIDTWDGDSAETLQILGSSPIISTADATSKTITISHTSSGANTSKGDASNQTPAFGGTFKALSATVDRYGHTTSLEEHTVKIPTLSASNSGGGSTEIGTITINGSSTTFKHPDISTSSTTSATDPGYSGTFTAVDTVERDGDGHVTKINTKTVTMPPSQTVNDNKITINLNGTTAGSFTLNQASATSINLTDTTYKFTTASTKGYVALTPYNGSTSGTTIEGQVYGLGDLAYSSDVTNKGTTITPGSTSTTIATVGGKAITLAVSNNFNAASSTTATNANNISISSTTDKVYLVGTSSASGYNAAQANTSIYMTNGTLTATKVLNAVWNDLVDCIEVPEDTKLDFGYAYGFDGKNYIKTSKKADPSYIGIHSDTYGMLIGHKENKKALNVAVAGFVLAYTDKIYKPGTPLTTTANGELTKADFLTKVLHPERIVGIFWKEEKAMYWGDEDTKVEVKGRSWIKIR